MITKKKLWLAGSVTVAYLAVVHPANSQIVPDGNIIKDNSFISSSTSGIGKSGNINLSAAGTVEIATGNIAPVQQFIGTSLAEGEPHRDRSNTINAATNGIGASSSIVIETKGIVIVKVDLPDITSAMINHGNNLSPLPTTLISVDQIVVKQCSSNINSNGLSSNPLGESFSSDDSIPDFNIPPVRSRNSQFFEPETSNRDFSLAQTISGEEAIEAQTWFRNKAGNVVLTAKGDRRNAKVNPHYCLF